MQSQQKILIVRALRSVLLVIAFTIAAMYFTRARFYPPHGHPLVYAIALSWLVAMTAAILTSAFFKATPRLFSLKRWEREGEFYDRADVRAFRWALLHSPLGWINGGFHLGTNRSDCARLLAEMNGAEGVHWLSCIVSTGLALSYIAGGYAMYGYVLLLVRIPFDLYPIMLQRWNRGRVARLLSRGTMPRQQTK